MDHNIMKKPIGIFDFGIGGLTVAREILMALPHESLIFLNDNLNLLAGYKPEDVVRKDTVIAVNFLLRHNVKALVIACNTATAVSLQYLRENCNIPIVGVIEPTARGATEITRNGRIGVVGTNMTIKSKAYPKILRKLNQSLKIFSQACPLLVPMIEDGILEGDKINRVASEYMTRLHTKGIDTLILGCTHYPLIRSVMESLLPGVKLVDPAPLTAMELNRVLTVSGKLNPGLNAPRHVFYSAQLNEKTELMTKIAFGMDLPETDLSFRQAHL